MFDEKIFYVAIGVLAIAWVGFKVYSWGRNRNKVKGSEQ